ncbi:hypothetical protein AMECASPLE_024776, partial [Ameca splendens]
NLCSGPPTTSPLYSRVTLTEVSVNQAHLRFVENYGFQFMIENFSFTLNFDSTNCSWLPTEVSITGLSATMEIGLTRNENRLEVNMRTCQASIDRIRFVGTSLPRGNPSLSSCSVPVLLKPGLKHDAVFSQQPWNLRQPLEAQVSITEVPSISITRDGFIFNVRPRVEVISPGTRTPDVFSLSAVCPISLMVTVEGNCLTLPSRDVSCRLETSNHTVAPLNTLLNNKATEFLSGLFGNGVEIPVPEGVNFTQGNIRYENGFVVVGGSLSFTPAGREKLVNSGLRSWRMNSPG